MACYPLDFENNIFKFAFSKKIFHPVAPGQIALGLHSFAQKRLLEI